ncbi:MAG: trigger factor [Candidatus Omnitrophota bacterium]|nr:trigger factor [Candidatus Omnitrophota bacterium]
MKSKIKKLNGTTKEFFVEMPKETVDRMFDEVLEGIRKTAKIPGFRPGNAPLDIVRKNYSEDAADEVKRRLIPQAYQQALQKHEIRPVSYPEISEVLIGLSGILTFKARVDAHPEINLRKYKGLKVTRNKISVTDEEITETLERLRNMNAEFPEIDRPIEKGDFGICDIETFINGEVIAKKRENMWIEADKEVSLLGMGEELCGLKKGDRKDIEVTLPENYPDKKYAGKKAVFRVEVRDVKEKKLPELDDELAKTLGKNSLDEAREEIRTQLLERKEANEKVNMKNQIMEQLLDRHSFDLPASMVSRQLKVLMERAENELSSKGVDKETIGSNREEMKGRLSKEAERKVRLYFMLDKIGDREGIDVSEEEIDSWLRSLADAYNKPLEEVEKYYKEHDLISGLKEQLREDKTVDFLLSEAVVTGEA